MGWQGLVLVAYCVVVPVVMSALARRFAWAKFLGPVLLCCAAGIAVANQPFWDPSTEGAEAMAKAARLIGQATIPLAIPLLLFQSDLSNLRAQGKTAIASFFVACVSVFVGVVGVSTLYSGALEDQGKVAGMILGVYIGGTPNLVAIQTAIGASEQDFGLVYAATTFVSSFYLLFLLTMAKPLLSRFFPAHPIPVPMGALEEQSSEARPLSKTLGLGAVSVASSVACVVVCAGLSMAIFGKIESLFVILGITTLAIAGSFIPKLRELPTHEPIGTFLILTFCVSAGTMMDVAKLISTGGVVLSLTAWSVLAFLTIHFLIHRLLRIDVDTTITMSVATMFGPPFIPAVVQALGNRSVLLPGMTMGFLGYAVGTYLGIAVGSWL